MISPVADYNKIVIIDGSCKDDADDINNFRVLDYCSETNSLEEVVNILFEDCMADKEYNFIVLAGHGAQGLQGMGSGRSEDYNPLTDIQSGSLDDIKAQISQINDLIFKDGAMPILFLAGCRVGLDVAYRYTDDPRLSSEEESDSQTLSNWQEDDTWKGVALGEDSDPQVVGEYNEDSIDDGAVFNEGDIKVLKCGSDLLEDLSRRISNVVVVASVDYLSYSNPESVVNKVKKGSAKQMRGKNRQWEQKKASTVQQNAARSVQIHSLDKEDPDDVGVRSNRAVRFNFAFNGEMITNPDRLDEIIGYDPERLMEELTNYK